MPSKQLEMISAACLEVKRPALINAPMWRVELDVGAAGLREFFDFCVDNLTQS